MRHFTITWKTMLYVVNGVILESYFLHVCRTVLKMQSKVCVYVRERDCVCCPVLHCGYTIDRNPHFPNAVTFSMQQIRTTWTKYQYCNLTTTMLSFF